jgi:hypothetical protein
LVNAVESPSLVSSKFAKGVKTRCVFRWQSQKVPPERPELI